LDELRALRAAAGPDFALYDGRSRYLQRSLDAGASGVVAVPLSTLPTDLPRRNLDGLQAIVDRGQAVVDGQPDLVAQADALQSVMLIHLLHHLLCCPVRQPRARLRSCLPRLAVMEGMDGTF